MCFDELAIYSIEIPRKEHGTADVLEAKRIEIENLMQYDTFEEINENTFDKEKKITSHWIITKKKDIMDRK